MVTPSPLAAAATASGGGIDWTAVAAIAAMVAALASWATVAQFRRAQQDEADQRRLDRLDAVLGHIRELELVVAQQRTVGPMGASDPRAALSSLARAVAAAHEDTLLASLSVAQVGSLGGLTGAHLMSARTEVETAMDQVKRAMDQRLRRRWRRRKNP